MTEQIELTYKQQWFRDNRDKMAIYARKSYQKKIEENPEFRKVLAQRTLERRRKLKEALPPKEPKKPKEEPKEEVEKIKKTLGRPRKYL